MNIIFSEKNKVFLVFLLICILISFVTIAFAEEQKIIPKETKEPVIRQGKKVILDYILIVDGEVFEQSRPEKPLIYIHGTGNLIPGLEDKLTGLKIGDQKTIVVSPELAYGPILKEAFKEVLKSELPKDATLMKGMYLKAESMGGVTMPVRIEEVRNNSVILNFNHPLAGKTLNFKVKILDIE